MILGFTLAKTCVPRQQLYYISLPPERGTMLEGKRGMAEELGSGGWEPPTV
jgi:hypothetical protein